MEEISFLLKERFNSSSEFGLIYRQSSNNLRYFFVRCPLDQYSLLTMSNILNWWRKLSVFISETTKCHWDSIYWDLHSKSSIITLGTIIVAIVTNRFKLIYLLQRPSLWPHNILQPTKWLWRQCSLTFLFCKKREKQQTN